RKRCAQYVSGSIEVYCSGVTWHVVTENNDDGVEVDESDRLPRLLVVGKFDIFCFTFSAISYIVDVACDTVTAYIHFRAQRFWAFLFVSLLTVLPSIALNLGPAVWYVDAIVAAVGFRSSSSDHERRYFYCRMVEADRDAFFEAFLESAPQVLVQGIVLAHSFWMLLPSDAIPMWMYFQGMSVVMSLLSVCWSVSIQHRSLRIARPDKMNMSPFETFLQLSWRCLTISARYILLVLFVLAFQYWTTAVAGLLLDCERFVYPHKKFIVLFALSAFISGIAVMLLYYWRWHPTRRLKSLIDVDSSRRAIVEQTFSEAEESRSYPSDTLKHIDSDESLHP
uniref:XK-related protein n=1 Tax=Parascaris equorum TaxID=6256 RepID=A0A914RMS0_PAREQ